MPYIPPAVYRTSKVDKILRKKNDLSIQFYAAVHQVLEGNIGGGRDFKKRKPYQDGIWSFRINKQYRALAYKNDNGALVVYAIDNHQNY